MEAIVRRVCVSVSVCVFQLLITVMVVQTLIREAGRGIGGL